MTKKKKTQRESKAWSWKNRVAVVGNLRWSSSHVWTKRPLRVCATEPDTVCKGAGGATRTRGARCVWPNQENVPGVHDGTRHHVRRDQRSSANQKSWVCAMRPEGRVGLHEPEWGAMEIRGRARGSSGNSLVWPEQMDRVGQKWSPE